ncbi:potassium-transporting ATPase subunit KdpC [Paenibacillus sp. URB8-2]|uniref:potassium-transporting ATPase subunit KdpC n=1 Tax=Paenibacillus sp. URB8-2 TaxID=2741301 RepID=UPI0015BC7978|nr:potassium-transporting ATPase subunit KdpC [Paenibacillus sp. URB8-2]BCG58774.1 potassium-transporting ATPase KdpC subunit [Paenibacillus sp. URB8-2]
MKTITVTLRTSIALMIIVMIYQLVVTGIAQAVMPDQANGSLVYNSNNEVVGSRLIGQTFSAPGYFHSRISSIEYNAASSGTPNYAPSNPDMLKRTKEAVEVWKQENPKVAISEVPVDLITNSGSGLDPHVSVAAAEVQIPRVSESTGIPADQLKGLVAKHTKERELGLFGEPAVNVLLLNMDVQKIVSGQ